MKLRLQGKYQGKYHDALTELKPSKFTQHGSYVWSSWLSVLCIQLGEIVGKESIAPCGLKARCQKASRNP